MRKLAGNPKQDVVIITGMHRSGTSLAASLVQSAGLDVGDRLIGKGRGNLRGHFEDYDFYSFHESILRRLGTTFLAEESIRARMLLADEVRRALNLVRERAQKSLWGWKDPRTCLFLEFWRDQLPRAKYIFVYRHPLEVVLSLMRRGSAPDIAVYRDLQLGLRSWEAHNRGILQIVREKPGDCFICHVSQIAFGAERFLENASRKLRLRLDASRAIQLCHREELKLLEISPSCELFIKRAMPTVAKVYQRLEECSDLPALPPTTSAVEFQHRIPDRVFETLVGSAAGDASHGLLTLLTLLDPAAVANVHNEWNIHLRRVESALDMTSTPYAEGQIDPQGLLTASRIASSFEVKLAGVQEGVRRLEKALTREKWRTFYAYLLGVRNRRLLVWGAGSGGKKVAKLLLRKGISFDAFVDSDPAKEGQHLLGRPILAACFRKNQRPAERPFVVIASIYGKAMARRLKCLGFVPDKDFISAPPIG